MNAMKAAGMGHFGTPGRSSDPACGFVGWKRGEWAGEGFLVGMGMILTTE